MIQNVDNQAFSIIKALPVPVIIVNKEGYILAKNELVNECLLLERDLIGDHFLWTVVHEKDRDIIHQFLKTPNKQPIFGSTIDNTYTFECKAIDEDNGENLFIITFSKVEEQLTGIFGKIIQDTSTSLAVIGKDMRVQYINESFEENFLQSKAEIIGKSVEDLGMYDQNLIDPIKKMINGKPCTNNFEITTILHGEKRFFKILLIPQRKNNEIHTIGILFYDITEQKKMDELMDLCWKNLYRIIEKTPYSVIKLDPFGFIKGINHSFKKLTNYVETDIVDKHISTILVNEEGNGTKSILKNLHNGEMEFFETKILSKEGKGIFVLASVVPMIINEHIQDIYIALKDVSFKKKMETELNEINDLLEAFFENSNDMICITDGQGKIIRINKKYEEIFEWSREELEGESILKVQGMEFLAQYEYLKDYLQKGLTVNNFETVHRTKSGEKVDVSLSISPILNQDGKMFAISSIYRDIRDKKQTDELLKKSEQLALIGQLAAGVAHEIRNPLTTLKGFVQLLKVENKEQNKYYEIMMEELNRIEMITTEFLALSKPHISNFERMDINEILMNVVSFINMEALKANVTIHFERTEDMQIKCDVNRLKQVFLNILKNGIEAMGSGGKIDVTVLKEGQSCKIEIKDNGVGISKERLKYIGQPFYSTKEKGTGLGLMISNKIIKEHKGKMEFNSIEGKGTTVTVYLPLEDGMDIHPFEANYLKKTQ